VSYIYGDACVHHHGHMLYSSRINFICDPIDGDGWPVLVQEEDCEFLFNWRTKYACDLCKAEDLKRVEGACDDGYRKIHLQATGNCTVLDDTEARW